MTDDIRERHITRYSELQEMVRLAVPGCIVWPYAKQTSNGYGRVARGGRVVFAHRAAWELVHGAIPEGLTIDHLCRNRACVNPAHLEPVPLRENIVRGSGPSAQNAYKTHCLRGHAFTPDNTAKGSDGGRACLACRAIRDHARNSRRPSRAKAVR